MAEALPPWMTEGNPPWMTEGNPPWMTEGNPFDLARKETGPELVRPKLGADTYDESLRLDQSGLPTVGSGALTVAESAIFGVGEVMDIFTLFKGGYTALTGDPKTGKFMMAVGLGGLAFPMAAGAMFRKLGGALTAMVRSGELSPKEAAIKMAEKVYEANKKHFGKGDPKRLSPGITGRGPRGGESHQKEWLESQAEMLEDMRQTPDYVFTERLPEDFIETGTRPGYYRGVDPESQAILPIHGREIGYDEPWVDPYGRNPFDLDEGQLAEIERIKHDPYEQWWTGDTVPKDVLERVRYPHQTEFERRLKTGIFNWDYRDPTDLEKGGQARAIARSVLRGKGWNPETGAEPYPLPKHEVIGRRTQKRDPMMTEVEDELKQYDPDLRSKFTPEGELLGEAELELDQWIGQRGDPLVEMRKKAAARNVPGGDAELESIISTLNDPDVSPHLFDEATTRLTFIDDAVRRRSPHLLTPGERAKIESEFIPEKGWKPPEE